MHAISPQGKVRLANWEGAPFQGKWRGGGLVCVATEKGKKDKLSKKVLYWSKKETILREKTQF